MNDKKHQYSSIHINFSSEAAHRFLAETKTIIKKSELHGQDSGRGLEKDPHITVLYGLHDVNPPLCAIDILETYPKFVIVLGDISLFKSKTTGNPFDVVKVDVKSTDLHVLNSSLSDECEHTSEFPEYIPHATIAYVNPDSHNHLDGLNIFRGLSFVANNAIFSSYNGTKRSIPFGVR